MWHLLVSCMWRHHFSSLKSNKEGAEAVSILSSRTFVTQQWESCAYIFALRVSRVGVWVWWRRECLFCKVWIMQTLKKALSPVPRATELGSIRYMRVMTTVPARKNCQPLLRLLPISVCMSSQLPLRQNSYILVLLHLSIPSLPTLKCWFTAVTL